MGADEVNFKVKVGVKVDEVSPEVALCIDDGGVWGHTQRGQVGSFVLMLGLGDITLKYYCDIDDINDT